MLFTVISFFIYLFCEGIELKLEYPADTLPGWPGKNHQLFFLYIIVRTSAGGEGSLLDLKPFYVVLDIKMHTIDQHT